MAGCTIVLRKQLASARVLAHSFKCYQPEAAFFILVIDGPVEEAPSADGVELLGLEDIDLEPGNAHRLPMLYREPELLELVRPRLLRTVLKSGASEVYFRINAAFKSLFVEKAGDYTISYAYGPSYFTLSVLVGGAGVTALLCWLTIMTRGGSRRATVS